MKLLKLPWFCCVLLTCLLLWGCDTDWLSSTPETFYSYRQVGQCEAGYVGGDHTPNVKIKKCLALITTKVSVNISQSTQTVTLIEQDLGINKQPEPMLLSATKLNHCSVVDRANFRCDGLERNDGSFVNTDLLGWRRLSDSKACGITAQYWGSGWIDDSTLSFHDPAWVAWAYTVGAIVIGLIVIAGVLG